MLDKLLGRLFEGRSADTVDNIKALTSFTHFVND